MSPLFNFHREPQPIYSDDELKQRKRNYEYRQKKFLKDIIMYSTCALILAITILIIIELCYSVSFRNFIVSQIENSFTGIIFSILTIFGITINNKNSN
jgi:hypothetical protein